MGPTIACAGQVLVHGPLDTARAEAAPLRRFLGGGAAFTNLEACVETEGAWPTKVRTLHLAAPGAIAGLRDLGFRALTHANNHAFDLGPPGLARTRAIVESVGLGYAGGGADAAEALRPARIETASGLVAVLAVDCGPQPEIAYAGPGRAGLARLAIRRTVEAPPAIVAALRALDEGLGDGRREAARAAVGYRAGPAPEGLELFGVPVAEGAGIVDRRTPDADDLAALAAAIVAARADGARLVAVCLHAHHWDPDWTRTPDWMLDIARSLIDAGADLVAGHGAPVLQGIAFHRGRPILAGLGNLVFHTRRPDAYRRAGVDVFRGAAFRAAFDAAGTCSRIDVLPVAVAPEAGAGPNPVPVPLAGRDADDIMERVTGRLTATERKLVHRAGPGTEG